MPSKRNDNCDLQEAHTCTCHLVVINVTGGKRSARGEEGVRGSEALEVHIDPSSSQTFDMDLDLPDNQLMQCDR